MNKFIFFFLLLFLSKNNFGQSSNKNVKYFYEYSYKSSIAYWQEKNPQQAILLLDSARQFLKLKPYHFLFLVDCFLETGDTIEALSNLNKSVINGVPIENIINRYSFLENSSFNKDYALIFTNYEQNRKKFLNGINVDFLILFREIYAEDQLLRKKPFSNNNQISEYLSTLDSFTFLKFQLLVEQFGFPSHSKIGYYSDISPILSHWSLINNETFKYLDSLMIQAINLGEFEPIDYAWIIDRRQLFKNLGPAIYGGTWPEEEYELIDDISTLDKRRKLVFLPTLEQDSQITGRKLPKEYIKGR